jgi:hypothetical protein
MKNAFEIARRLIGISCVKFWHNKRILKGLNIYQESKHVKKLGIELDEQVKLALKSDWYISTFLTSLDLVKELFLQFFNHIIY